MYLRKRFMVGLAGVRVSLGGFGRGLGGLVRGSGVFRVGLNISEILRD